MNEQQKIALDEQRRLFEQSAAINLNISKQAAILLQSSSILIGLVSAAQIATKPLPSSGLSLALVAAIVAAFAVMVFFAVRVWLPSDKLLPQQSIWADIFNDQINVSVDEAFQQHLSNYLAATESNFERNGRIARELRLAGGAFIVQVVLILLMAVI